MATRKKKNTEDDIPLINEHSLFAPRSDRSILNEYPELRNVDEFKKLTKADMLFVWYYGCEASPLAGIKNDRTRAERAIDQITRIDPKLITTKFERYIALDFDDKMAPAIHRMEQYRMGVRIRGKKMIDNIIDNYEKIMKLDINGPEFIDKDGGKDFTKIKQYVDSSKTISTNIPSLIDQAEKGFSITEVTSDGIEESGDGLGIMDDFFDELDN